jgi:predicted nuclease of predicted toxin-antitoxin system
LKILLDENFPLPLYHQLRSAGYDTEHIIVLGQRGTKDSEIRERLVRENLVFLTQDTEFADVASDYRAKVIISRVRQNLSIHRRVEIWFNALQRFMIHPGHENLFDLLESGEIIPWEVRKTR